MNFSPEQQKHLGLAALAVVAFVTIYFGISTIPGRLIQPFRLLPKGASGVTADKEAQKQAQIAELKQQDTDRDGLSDYDEMTLYKTSPYIEDTDSDGVKDQEEIAQGEDPNCPKGQDCRIAVEPPPSTQDAIKDSLQKGIAPQAGLSIPAVPSPLDGLSADLTAAQIRELLAAQGFKKEDLAKIDDTTLKEVWQETLKQVQKQTQGGTPQPKASPSLSPNPTSQELRTFLLQAGFDAKLLETVDDVTLMKMYEETIKKIP